MAKIGVLLVNLGTPDAPREAEVREYLREFLMDPLVLDISYPARWFLVNGVILRKRPKTSAEAYEKVWTDRGSPLLFHTMDLGKKVQDRLGSEYVVKIAMRYGKPSMETALLELVATGVQSLVVLPLYPQYSLAATESSIREFHRIREKHGLKLPFSIIPEFYKDEGFIDAFAEVARETLPPGKADFVLFSFHGLPERQVKKTDPTGAHCFQAEACCERFTAVSPQCYRAHSYETAHRIAQRMGLSAEGYTVAFQSRLGNTPWIKPYSDHLYDSLPKKGVRRLAVICPSFVADCLETIEEVGIRGREQFKGAGGEELYLVPSLNSNDSWARAVADLVTSGGGRIGE